MVAVFRAPRLTAVLDDVTPFIIAEFLWTVIMA